jgi:tyrosyl-tRNA synthetase
MVRRMAGGKAYAITCPLITKADGGKFGKTESGNIWLDPKKTSPYKFYQFWLNTSDADAEKYAKIFTLLTKDEIAELVAKHNEAPHLRVLQQKLAEEVTVMVHSREDYEAAVEASQILFGKATSESLKNLSEDNFLSVFEGVPQGTVAKADIEAGLSIVDALSDVSGFLKSKGEARRALKENSISVNKEKIKDDYVIETKDLINGKYILLQRGKKNYFLLIAE